MALVGARRSLRRCGFATSVRYIPYRAFSASSSRKAAQKPVSSRKNGGFYTHVILFTVALGLYQFSQRLLKQYPQQAADRYKNWRAKVNAPDYTTLKQGRIRVLVLHPGQLGTPISCTLTENVALDNTARFEALSYVWGDGQDIRKVTCGGKAINVTRNLYEALHRLRLPDRDRVIWVDAICINQQDSLDKSQQIPLMSRVYEEATQVLIWLGEPKERSRHALKVLREVNKYLSAISTNYNESQGSIITQIYTYFQAGGTDLTRKQYLDLAAFDWKAISDILEHPWFRRVWVYQEFSKATHAVIVLGSDQISFWSFMRPIAELPFSPDAGLNTMMPYLSPEARQSILAMRKTVAMGTVKQGHWSGKLLDIVPEGSARYATNDRDRIYAFLDLAHDFGPGDWELVPDYTASVEEVYHRFARWYLLRKSDLSCLQFCTREVRKHRQLPSWVPNWTRKIEQPIDSNKYQASPVSEPWISWRPYDPDVLRIKGQIVDRIEEVSVSRIQLLNLTYLEENLKVKHDPSNLDEHLKRAGLEHPRKRDRLTLNILRESVEARHQFGSENVSDHEMMIDLTWMGHCKMVASRGNGLLTGETLDAFYQSILSFHPSGNLSKTDFLSYVKLLEDVRDGKEKTQAPAKTESNTTHRGYLYGAADLQRRAQIQAFAKEAAKLREQDRLRLEVNRAFVGLLMRRFCRTEKNRIGWVPHFSEPGDLICVLDGGRVPFVLRPKKGSDSTNKFQRLLLTFGLGTRGPSSLFQEGIHGATRYELIGDCYVHGIMHGEIAKIRDSTNVVLEIC